MFFHTFTPEGHLHWQGEVIAHPTPDTVKVQLYSWDWGDATDIKVLPISATRGWQFYKTLEVWHANAERMQAQRAKELAGKGSR